MWLSSNKTLFSKASRFGQRAIVCCSHTWLFLTPWELEICFDLLYLQGQLITYTCKHSKCLMKGRKNKANKDEGKEEKKEGKRKGVKESGRWLQQGSWRPVWFKENLVNSWGHSEQEPAFRSLIRAGEGVFAWTNQMGVYFQQEHCTGIGSRKTQLQREPIVHFLWNSFLFLVHLIVQHCSWFSLSITSSRKYFLIPPCHLADIITLSLCAPLTPRP